MRSSISRRKFIDLTAGAALLAIHAIREGRSFKYDGSAHKAVAV